MDVRVVCEKFWDFSSALFQWGVLRGESTQSCEARFSPLRHPSFRARNSARPLHNVTLLVRSCIPLLSPIYHCADYNCMFCFTTSKSQTIHSSIQEQACYAGRLPSPSHPIGTASRKQYRRIHRPIKKSHTLKKVRLPCVARRGGARGGETAFATPSASPSRKLPPSKRPNLYPKNKKIKTYKKRDRQTNKVQQSQKRKKLFLFLHFFIYS